MPERTNEAREAEWASAPAEFAAWISSTTIPAAPSSAEHPTERGELAAGVVVLGFVGDGEVGEHADQPRRRAAFDRLGERRGVAHGRPDPVHPGVDLEVHGMVHGPGGGERVELARACRR